MDPIPQFLKLAQQFSSRAQLDGVDVGVVALDNGAVLALRVVLAKGPIEPLESIETSVVTASRGLFPLASLPQFLDSLAKGVVDLGVRRFTIGQPPVWTFQERHFPHDQVFGGLFSSFALPSDALPATSQAREALDRRLASECDHRFASIGRVVRAFTGHDWNWDAVRLEVLAPWPVHRLSATVRGRELEVDVQAAAGLGVADFIVNIEGASIDRRVSPEEFKWVETPIDKRRVLHRGRLPGIAHDAKTVNLFVRGLPSVALRSEIHRPSESFFAPVPEPVASTPAGALRLSRFSLQRYRAIDSAELDFDLHPFTVVVGPNQSGKSTLLDALDLLAHAGRGELAQAVAARGGLESLLPRTSDQKSLGMVTEVRDGVGTRLRHQLELRALGAFDFEVAGELIEEEQSSGWRPLLRREGQRGQLLGSGTWLELRTGHRESALSGSTGVREIDELGEALGSIAVFPHFKVEAAWAASDKRSAREPSDVEPGAQIRSDGSNLVAALYSMQERHEDYERLESFIRLLFPSFIRLEFPAVAAGRQMLVWRDESGSYNSSELSDGTLSLLCLACALLENDRALVAIDEPEQHLHPDAIHRLLGLAETASVDKPVLFMTQSDTLLGLLDETPGVVAVMQRFPEGTRLTRPPPQELQEWLKTFGLGELRKDLEHWTTDA